MPLVGLQARFERQSGMKIEWHVEVLNRGPEGTVLREVVEDSGIDGTDLRESIYERAAEAQLLDTTRQFLGCGLRILHRQGGKSFEVPGGFGDVFGEVVICGTGQGDGLRSVGNGLDILSLTAPGIHTSRSPRSMSAIGAQFAIAERPRRSGPPVHAGVQSPCQQQDGHVSAANCQQERDRPKEEIQRSARAFDDPII